MRLSPKYLAFSYTRLLFVCVQDIGDAVLSDDATQVPARLSELPDDVRELLVYTLYTRSLLPSGLRRREYTSPLFERELQPFIFKSQHIYAEFRRRSANISKDGLRALFRGKDATNLISDGAALRHHLSFSRRFFIDFGFVFRIS